MEMKHKLVNFPIICPSNNDYSFNITFTNVESSYKIFDDLLKKVNDQVSKFNKKYYILRTYFQTSLKNYKDKFLDYYEGLIPFYIIFFENPFKKVLQIQENSNKKELFIEYKQDETISDLQNKLREILKTNKNYYIRISNKKLLSENKKIHELEENEDLEFFERQKQNANFVDLEKNITKDLKFSKYAPEYRKCQQGLNIFGKCPNELCKAFKLEVVCPWNYDHFDLIMNTCDVNCPSCNEKITPETCGFWNCYFTFKGIKINDKGPINVISLKWFIAGKENLTYFDPSNDNKVRWRYLKIFVSFEVPEDACPICLKINSGNVETLDCNHSYHKECIDSHQIGIQFKCLLCSNF